MSSACYLLYNKNLDPFAGGAKMLQSLTNVVSCTAMLYKQVFQTEKVQLHTDLLLMQDTQGNAVISLMH